MDHGVLYNVLISTVGLLVTNRNRYSVCPIRSVITKQTTIVYFPTAQ